MGKPLDYAYILWPRLRRYALDERYHIDNNDMERYQRPAVLGRKKRPIIPNFLNIMQDGLIRMDTYRTAIIVYYSDSKPNVQKRALCVPATRMHNYSTMRRTKRDKWLKIKGAPTTFQ
jgi:hypothetical protein